MTQRLAVPTILRTTKRFLFGCATRETSMFCRPRMRSRVLKTCHDFCFFENCVKLLMPSILFAASSAAHLELARIGFFTSG